MLVWTGQVLAKPAVSVRRPSGFLLTALPAAAATLAIAAQASSVASARHGAGSGEPAWLEPAASAVVAQPAVFRWAAVPGADRYRLRVGSAPGADDLLNVKGIPATSTSYRFPGELPALKPLYARVSALRAGTWRHAEVRFAADHVAAEWVYPLPGSAEVMPGRAFAWTPVSGATEYRVEIGTAPGLSDVLDRTVEGPTSLDVADLPRGRRLVARLSTHVQDGWYARDNVFAVALGYRGAEPLHPRPGGMANPGRPFTWQSVPLATGYRLRIGATPGSSALFDSGVLGGLQHVRPGTADRADAVRDAHDGLHGSHARASLRVPGGARHDGRERLRRGGARRHRRGAGDVWGSGRLAEHAARRSRSENSGSLARAASSSPRRSCARSPSSATGCGRASSIRVCSATTTTATRS